MKGEEKGRRDGTGAPEGWLGEGRSSYTQWYPPTVRGPVAAGETLGEGRKGTEGNGASALPVCLSTGDLLGS